MYRIDRHNIHEYLGHVVGADFASDNPGGGFTSSGPHGMSSIEAQRAAEPVDVFSDPSMFGFDDEEPMTAQGAADAVSDTVDDILANPAVFDGSTPVGPPSSAPSFTPAASSDDDAPLPGIDPSLSQPAPSSGIGSTSVLLLVAAAVGVAYAIFGE